MYTDPYAYAKDVRMHTVIYIDMYIYIYLHKRNRRDDR